jgi:probable F420-dependent oxidoreductase
MTVKVSTGLPNCREGRLNPVGAVDPAWLKDVAQSAEGLGYFSLWLNEFLTTDPSVLANFDRSPNYYDALTTIAYLSAITETIRFLPSTIVLPLHEPLLLARQLGAIDAFSGGRITLGVGLGGGVEEFRRIRGELVSPNRGRMLNEYLAALRVLWTEDKATFSGEYVKFEDIELLPKPTQSPLPIYLAGTAEAVFERITEYGQGWIDTILSADDVATTRDRLGELARERHGANAVVPQVARQFYVSIADSTSAAEQNLADSLPGARTPPSPAGSMKVVDMTVVGTPDHVYEVIARHVAAGATEVCAIFYSPDARSAIEQMTLFRNEVVSRL